MNQENLSWDQKKCSVHVPQMKHCVGKYIVLLRHWAYVHIVIASFYCS